MKKKIAIGLLALGCIYALYVLIDSTYSYEKVKESGHLIGTIEEYCLNCDTDEEFYALMYEEGSIRTIHEDDLILVSVNVKDSDTSSEFVQDDCIYVEFDEYKISQNGREIIIEIPTVIQKKGE